MQVCSIWRLVKVGQRDDTKVTSQTTVAEVKYDTKPRLAAMLTAVLTTRPSAVTFERLLKNGV